MKPSRMGPNSAEIGSTSSSANPNIRDTNTLVGDDVHISETPMFVSYGFEFDPDSFDTATASTSKNDQIFAENALIDSLANENYAEASNESDIEASGVDGSDFLSDGESEFSFWDEMSSGSEDEMESRSENENDSLPEEGTESPFEDRTDSTSEKKDDSSAAVPNR